MQKQLVQAPWVGLNNPRANVVKYNLQSSPIKIDVSKYKAEVKSVQIGVFCEDTWIDHKFHCPCCAYDEKTFKEWCGVACYTRERMPRVNFQRLVQLKNEGQLFKIFQCVKHGCHKVGTEPCDENCLPNVQTLWVLVNLATNTPSAEEVFLDSYLDLCKKCGYQPFAGLHVLAVKLRGNRVLGSNFDDSVAMGVLDSLTSVPLESQIPQFDLINASVLINKRINEIIDLSDRGHYI